MTASASGIYESRPTAKNGMPALLCRPSAPGTYPCAMILHKRYGLVPQLEIWRGD